MAFLDDPAKRQCAGCLLITGLLLLVILLPISFSYIEYYEYGLLMRKSTGSVNTDEIYSRGRYMVGPDSKFLKYQADAHHEHFEELSVFSAGAGNNKGENDTTIIDESVGLEFKIDIDFTYLLIEDEIGILHKELASSYKTIIEARTRDAIKNKASTITFTEYFQQRKLVEEKFRIAVQERWNDRPSLHCILDQFHLGRIAIPDTVAAKQLQTKLQNERNVMEALLQQAEIEREMTKVEVNKIQLEKDKVLRTANAHASLVRSNAYAQSTQIIQYAQINGTKLLFNAADITNQDHMTTFTYIRTLMKRTNTLEVDISYLNENSIIRTTPAVV